MALSICAAPGLSEARLAPVLPVVVPDEPLDPVELDVADVAVEPVEPLDDDVEPVEPDDVLVPDDVDDPVEPDDVEIAPDDVEVPVAVAALLSTHSPFTQ